MLNLSNSDIIRLSLTTLNSHSTYSSSRFRLRITDKQNQQMLSLTNSDELQTVHSSVHLLKLLAQHECINKIVSSLVYMPLLRSLMTNASLSASSSRQTRAELMTSLPQDKSRQKSRRQLEFVFHISMRVSWHLQVYSPTRFRANVATRDGQRSVEELPLARMTGGDKPKETNHQMALHARTSPKRNELNESACVAVVSPYFKLRNDACNL